MFLLSRCYFGVIAEDSTLYELAPVCHIAIKTSVNLHILTRPWVLSGSVARAVCIRFAWT